MAKVNKQASGAVLGSALGLLAGATGGKPLFPKIVIKHKKKVKRQVTGKKPGRNHLAKGYDQVNHCWIGRKK